MISPEPSKRARHLRAGLIFLIAGMVITAIGEISTFFLDIKYDGPLQVVLLVLMIALLYYTIKRR